MKSEPQIPGREGRFAYSINEVCARTNLGRDAVYRAISAGQLVARKFGRRTLITDDDLRQFLAGLPRAGGHEQVAVRSPEAATKTATAA